MYGSRCGVVLGDRDVKDLVFLSMVGGLGPPFIALLATLAKANIWGPAVGWRPMWDEADENQVS